MKQKKRYKAAFVIVGLVFGLALGGCQKKEIAFTTGLTKNQVFKIDGEECKLSEANVLLLSMQSQYEKLFGADNWSQAFGKETIGTYVKEQTIRQLSQLKSLSMMAEAEELKLTKEENEKIEQAARDYIQAVPQAQLDQMRIDETAVISLYRQYCLANKVYEDIISEVDSEISDDEARIITVQHILIKTTKTDDAGNEVALSKEEMDAVRIQAEQICELAKSGTDFEKLSSEYSQDSTLQYVFGRGEMPEAFESEAFNLVDEEISSVVETEYGLHIIKCMSNYDETKTLENKKKIYKQRCVAALNKKYDAFMKDLLTEFNDDTWSKVELKSSEETGMVPDFYAVYRDYFPEQEKTDIN